MFAGYMQAAAHTNLQGFHGLAAWMRVFQKTGITSMLTETSSSDGFPSSTQSSQYRFAFYKQHFGRNLSPETYIAIRKVPSSSQKSQTAENHASLHLLSTHLPATGSRDMPRLSNSNSQARCLKCGAWSTIFRRVLARWYYYLFVLAWTLMDQNFQPYSTQFSLYLKAKPRLYSVTTINTLPNIATAASILSALGCGIAADRIENFRVPALVISVLVLVSMLLFNIWDVGEAGCSAASMTIGFEGAVNPMTMSRASVTMVGHAEERAIVTASVNAIGQAFSAWTQLFQSPAGEAPNLGHGPARLLSGNDTAANDLDTDHCLAWAS